MLTYAHKPHPTRALPTEEDRAPATRLGIGYVLSSNHWANLHTTKKYVQQQLVPFINKERARLGLPSTFPAVWIIDCWGTHIDDQFTGWMAEKYPNIRLLFFPANCTGVMQPADVGGQREMKCFLRAIGTHFAMVQTRAKLKELEGLSEEARQKEMEAFKIDTTITALKPLIPAWHAATMQQLEDQGALLKGWERAQLLEALGGETGDWLYKLAGEKAKAGTLWINTRAAASGVAIPKSSARVKVATRVVTTGGRTDVVVEEEDVEEPKESKADVAEGEEELARRAAAAEKVRVWIHGGGAGGGGGTAQMGGVVGHALTKLSHPQSTHIIRSSPCGRS